MAIYLYIYIYIYIYMQEGMMRVGLFSFLTIHMLLCLLKVSNVFGVNAFNYHIVSVSLWFRRCFESCNTSLWLVTGNADRNNTSKFAKDVLCYFVFLNDSFHEWFCFERHFYFCSIANNRICWLIIVYSRENTTKNKFWKVWHVIYVLFGSKTFLS